MGLHLNYELRLPASVSRAKAIALLGRLRDFALTTQVDEVSPLADVSGECPDESNEDGAQAWRCIHWWAEFLGDPSADEEEPRYIGDPRSAVGFRVDPGDRSETATFGLMYRHAEIGDHEEWFWWCACKTQYASVISDDHLIRVHTSLVAILDVAIELGFDVEVRDETGYWQSRSTAVLVAEVAKMNRIVAKFAGAFSDAIGDQHDVRASIFEHPRFERLEMGES
jgi:hypothetical protein